MTQNYRVTSVTLVLGGWEPKWTSSVADVFCKGAEMITADLEVFFPRLLSATSFRNQT